MDLKDSVAEQTRELAPGARRLVVAVSGGADSVAALRLLHGSGMTVVAAHLDHALRAGSVDDATFVRQLCEALDVELIERRVDVRAVAERRGWNLEDGARRLRYSFLHQAARDVAADAIVVAHTLDDQAETFLMQALRGSAYPAGMRQRRGMVIRPLLAIERDALRRYLIAIDQGWREDPTNQDVTRTRAWVRGEVLPLLEARAHGATRRLAATAGGIGEARDALAAVADSLFGSGPLRVRALARAPRAIARSAVAGLLARAGVAADTELIEAVMAAVTGAAPHDHSGPWRRSVGEDTVVRVAYGRVEAARTVPGALEAPLRVTGVGAWRDLLATPALAAVAALRGSGALPDEATVAAWSAEYDDLVLRHREAGDHVELPGGTKLLSDLLVDRKVPREDRDALLVLASGERVLWVSGVPVDGGRTRDERFMTLALEQARQAAAAGELPVGAVLVRDDVVIATARNRSEATGDPTTHAEVEVMRAAGAASGEWRLSGTTLYVTLEPCPMCFGAVLQTRIARVVYGASNPREGALGGVMDLRVGPWKRTPVVEGGVLEGRCAELLTSFFAALRGD